MFQKSIKLSRHPALRPALFWLLIVCCGIYSVCLTASLAITVLSINNTALLQSFLLQDLFQIIGTSSALLAFFVTILCIRSRIQ